jgi:hypothetical protein
MAGPRQAVLVPGRGYDLRAPLFAYARESLTRSGFDVRGVDWRVPELTDGEHRTWVPQQVEPVANERTDLLVGKSLGSFAAPLAADRRLPAVWLTPILGDPALVDALRRAPAPFLLIGGTADFAWDGAAARRLTPHVLEVDGADHSMLVPGPMAGSAAVLGRVCTAIEEFVAEHVPV